VAEALVVCLSLCDGEELVNSVVYMHNGKNGEELKIMGSLHIREILCPTGLPYLGCPSLCVDTSQCDKHCLEASQALSWPHFSAKT
jgi:hypothetical protein